jgi:hypothetical protein
VGGRSLAYRDRMVVAMDRRVYKDQRDFVWVVEPSAWALRGRDWLFCQP